MLSFCGWYLATLCVRWKTGSLSLSASVLPNQIIHWCINLAAKHTNLSSIMGLTQTIKNPIPCLCYPRLKEPTKTQSNSRSCSSAIVVFRPKPRTVTLHSYSKYHESETTRENFATIPTMTEIMESSRAQNLNIQLQTLGPWFRITAKSFDTQKELGKAEGLIRIWLEGKILHLDNIRLSRETLGLAKSIFGIGLFMGAVAIRHGYDSGCKKAELLAINDTDLYHSKLVRFYTRMGFKAVEEVSGSSIGDVGHMLVWGGVGTRMDANTEDLLVKWAPRLRIRS